MLSLDQDSFQLPNPPPPPEREALVLHRHAGQGQSRAVVLFVHGFGGHRYATWDRFPHLLFEAFPAVDVGMHAYVNGLRRLRFWRSARFEHQAQVLADLLRDELKAYEKIILVTHSQGSLLATMAICSLIQRDDRATLGRLAGLFLMAGGMAGSEWITFLVSWVAGDDLRVLKPDSLAQQQVWRCFADRVTDVPDPGDRQGGRFVIPRWAGLADADKVVHRIGAQFDLPSDRIKNIPGDHFSIVKPAMPDHPGFSFVRERIAFLLGDATGQAPQRSAEPAARPRPATSTATGHGKGNASMNPSPFFWQHPDADALYRRLVTAYGTTRLDRVRYLAERAGIVISGFWNDRLSAGEIWRLLLEAAQDQGRAVRLIDLTLEDESIAAHHAEIRRLSAGLRGDAGSGSGGTGSGGGGGGSATSAMAAPTPRLDADVRLAIVDLLVPICQDSDSRRALVGEALFGHPVHGQIGAYNSAASDFATMLVNKLWDYDDGLGDRPALRLLMAAMRRRVGVEKQRQIDELAGRVWMGS